MKKKVYKHIIGIDEVGRGPLAGPVAVGAVKLKVESLKLKVEWGKDFRDSKKLSAKGRETWLVKIDEAVSEGWLEYAVAFVSPSVIDKKGLSYAIRTAIEKALAQLGNETSKLTAPIPKCPRREPADSSKFNSIQDANLLIRQHSTLVLLDGGLRAPAHYLNQETIIKGDEKELSIALASIVAKVARDKKMIALAKKFPEYGFEKHKGYGTRAHYEAIKKHGITPHHRKSFLKNIIK